MKTATQFAFYCGGASCQANLLHLPRDERSGHGARASSLAYPATGVALWRTARLPRYAFGRSLLYPYSARLRQQPATAFMLE
jgi:hypothetical protein